MMAIMLARSPIRRSVTTTIRRSDRRGRRNEAGYILLAILLMLALLMISLVAVAPKIATEIRRDREDELIHRGRQYARAIRLYYRKFGRYPAKIEDLENTNNLRFLRKRYKDPITGQDFALIRFGQAHTSARGFFGQPAQGVVSGAVSPTGTFSPLMGNPPTVNTTDTSGSPPTTDTSGNPPSPQSPGNPPTPTGIAQTTFGGGAIVGVKSTSPKVSIKEINGKGHYNEWEFVYDPQQDLMGQGAQLPGGMPNVPGVNPNPNTTKPPNPNPMPQ
jgi:type II secretory pathway pseudopilin PulG